MRSDGELVRAADDGDAAAWTELVERHGQLVYANARAVGADAAMAQDVGQLVWMRLLNRLDTLRDPDRVRGWLAIVARNTTRSELRKRKPAANLDELFAVGDPAQPDPGHEAARNDEAALVRRALAAVSERCAELLTLLFSAELSYDEISAVTGMPIGSIGPTRQRCLDAVAQQLAQEGSHG